MGKHAVPASTDQLRLGVGFNQSERDEVVARLRKLDRRLKRFDGDATELEVSVKDRDSNEQQVVLEARLPGYDRFVATSRQLRLKEALTEVREEIWRQIDDAVTRRTDRQRRS